MNESEKLVNDLIKFYLEETSKRVIDIPENYISKREFLRGLLNVREPKIVPIDIIEKENELLNLDLKNKKIIDINTFDKRFSLYQGDITCIKCEAIINPSDNKMLGCTKPNHNCVSNKIHTYAGVSLRLKCREITKGQNIETSKVILTDGYNLPCDYIIHTVKPIIEDELTEEIKENIKNFYINSLELCKKNNIKTVCLPNLSVNNVLKEDVAKITINTIKEYLKKNKEIKKVLFNVYTLDDYNIYEKYIVNNV